MAVAAACATFPLVVVGGLVTTTHVGMADPEWPTPPWYLMRRFWAGDAMDRGLGFVIEHGHRLLGWLVGLLTLALATGLWFQAQRAWLRWLGCIALGAVVAQGVLGGLRVVFQNQTMALVHGISAQLFFAFMVCLAALTGRSWAVAPTPIASQAARRIQRLALLTTAFVVVQLVFGATLRHLGHMWALAGHLFVAFAILIHVALIAKRVFAGPAVQARLIRSVELLVALVLCQLMLGSGAWATSTAFGSNVTTAQSGSQIFFATAHMAVGSLILATSALLVVQCYMCLVPLAGPDFGRPSTPRSERSAVQTTRPSVSSLESRDLLRSGVTL